MLLIAIENKKKKQKRVVSRIPDDSALETAVEVATSLARSEKRNTFVYLKANGTKPLLVKSIIRKKLGGIKVK